eukprot:1157898-Pelagomonas_calceolata.AAC.17
MTQESRNSRPPHAPQHKSFSTRPPHESYYVASAHSRMLAGHHPAPLTHDHSQVNTRTLTLKEGPHQLRTACRLDSLCRWNVEQLMCPWTTQHRGSAVSSNTQHPVRLLMPRSMPGGDMHLTPPICASPELPTRASPVAKNTILVFKFLPSPIN